MINFFNFGVIRGADDMNAVKHIAFRFQAISKQMIFKADIIRFILKEISERGVPRVEI